MKLWIERNAWGWLGGSQTLPGSRRFNYGANQRRTSRSNFSNWRPNSANWGCKKSLAETLPSWTKCTHLPFSLSLYHLFILSPSDLIWVLCAGGPHFRHDLRKSIARVLTVINANQRAQLRIFYKKKKYAPLDLRPKATRAIRRRLSKHESSKVTEKQRKKTTHFPQRKYAVKVWIFTCL